MNDVAMPIRPNSDQASTADAGRTTSRSGGISRSVVRNEGGSISIGGMSRLTGGKSGGFGAGGATGSSAGGLKKVVGGDAEPAGRPRREKSRLSRRRLARGVCKALSRVARPRAPARILAEARGRGSRCGKTRLRPAGLRAGDRSGRREWRPRPHRDRPKPAGFGGEIVEAELAPDLCPLISTAVRRRPPNRSPGRPGPPYTGDTTQSSRAFPGGEARSWLH